MLSPGGAGAGAVCRCVTVNPSRVMCRASHADDGKQANERALAPLAADAELCASRGVLVLQRGHGPRISA